MANFDYIQYGTATNAEEIERFLEHCIATNEAAEQQGRRKTPVCIWGKHGIGKTELVEAFARKNGYHWAYIAPAQFEEMGDLLGMPVVKDGKTVFATPQWVPTQAGKGIFLLDDVNRADDRILRGIMQLLQNHELISWKLPPHWHIVLTANPDGGDYSVTPMDDAMLTRMRHITLVFDLKTWAKWAEAQQILPQGINFVIAHPELVTGQRTTPRTLVQFFEALRPLDNLLQHLPLVQLLGDATLDETTVQAFIAFLQNEAYQLPEPQQILQTPDFEAEILPCLQRLHQADTLRVDALATLNLRLTNYLILHELEWNKTEIRNFKAYFSTPLLPNELKLTLAQDLAAAQHPKLQQLLADPAIGRVLLTVL